MGGIQEYRYGQEGVARGSRTDEKEGLKPVCGPIRTSAQPPPALTEDLQRLWLRAERFAVNKTLSLPSPGFSAL